MSTTAAWHRQPPKNDEFAAQKDAPSALVRRVKKAERGKSQRRPYDRNRHLLFLRFALVNLVAFSLLGAAYGHGLVTRVVSADRTLLSVVIFAVFLVGLLICTYKVWQTSSELNDVRRYKGRTVRRIALLGNDAESRANLADALRLRLLQRIVGVRHIANSLVLLGLIGTVLGFIIALSGVDPDQASDVTAITPMVATLINGMSTALYTTLVGAVFHLWLMGNYQLLAAGTIQLIASTVEQAESNARAGIV